MYSDETTDISRIIPGLTPKKIIAIIRIIRGQNSSLFREDMFNTESQLGTPNKTLLPNHKEYDAANTRVIDAKSI